jgi:hypothetical protein
MYRWNVVITLKSGKEINVMYDGRENDSGEVAKKIMAGGVQSMNGFYDFTRTHNILVLVGEIAALDISEYKPEKEKEE